MRRTRSTFVTISLLALMFQFLFVLPPLPTHAQANDLAIVATGLTNPRGFTWSYDGRLVIAEAGSGGTTEGTGEATVPPPAGPYTGGTTASVVAIDNNCPVLLAGQLPSAQSAAGEVVGVADVAYLGEKLYALISGGGDAHGNPDQPTGLYSIGTAGEVDLVVDLGDWLRNNPVASTPDIDFDPEGSFYSMVANPDASALWVVESNSEQVLSISAEGKVTRLVDLSNTNQVPTAITPAPGGGLYVGFLTSAPFPEGEATVINVGPDGSWKTVWSGLTTITGLATGPDGTLYASQLSTTRIRPPFLQPATGSVVRQTGERTSEVVANGLNFPVAIDFGPDGALYVSAPAIGANDGTGSIIRFTPGAQPIEINEDSLPKPACGDGTAGATNAGTNTNDAPTEVIVRIFDFGFDKSDMTVPVGTTIMWVNTGAVQHTTVALVDGERYWDSGIMEPGATFSFTFDEPGTWEYVCGLHPDMNGTVTVE